MAESMSILHSSPSLRVSREKVRSQLISYKKTLAYLLLNCITYLYQGVYAPLVLVSGRIAKALPPRVGPNEHFSLHTVNFLRVLSLFLSVPFVVCLTHNMYLGCTFICFVFNFLLHLDRFVEVENMKTGELRKEGHMRSEYYQDVCERGFHIACLWSLIVQGTTKNLPSWFSWIFFTLAAAELIYTLILAAIRIDDSYPATPSSVASFARIGGYGYRFGVSILGKVREKLGIFSVGAVCVAMHFENTWLAIFSLVCFAVVIFLNHNNLMGKIAAKRATYASRTEETHTLAPQDLSLLVDHPEPPHYDVVYSIGCFDLFHAGHVILMQKMRAKGKKLVIGVHDDESIFLLKNRYPIENTVRRVRNVKRFADQVFVIPSTDPSAYLDAIVDRSVPHNKMVFIRGADMPNFPGKEIAEALMDIVFLPYTEGISSTMLRARLLERRRLSQIDEGVAPELAESEESASQPSESDSRRGSEDSYIPSETVQSEFKRSASSSSMPSASQRRRARVDSEHDDESDLHEPQGGVQLTTPHNNTPTGSNNKTNNSNSNKNNSTVAAAADAKSPEKKERRRRNSWSNLNIAAWVRFNNEWIRTDQEPAGIVWLEYGHDFYRYNQSSGQ